MSVVFKKFRDGGECKDSLRFVAFRFVLVSTCSFITEDLVGVIQQIPLLYFRYEVVLAKKIWELHYIHINLQFLTFRNFYMRSEKNFSLFMKKSIFLENKRNKDKNEIVLDLTVTVKIK